MQVVSAALYTSSNKATMHRQQRATHALVATTPLNARSRPRLASTGLTVLEGTAHHAVGVTVVRTSHTLTHRRSPAERERQRHRDRQTDRQREREMLTVHAG